MKLKVNLLPFCLAISLIGIFLLFFLSTTLQPKQTSIQTITRNLLNKQIQIQGQVSNIRSYENSNFQIISIKDSTGEINIILNQIITLKNNQSITILGKVTEYNNILQITADKIKEG